MGKQLYIKRIKMDTAVCNCHKWKVSNSKATNQGTGKKGKRKNAAPNKDELSYHQNTMSTTIGNMKLQMSIWLPMNLPVYTVLS